MNEKIIDIFEREIVASLPLVKRKVYQFIENAEEELAMKSDTREEFLSLLKLYSPYKQAAQQFNFSLEDLYKMMIEIETEINSVLDKKLENYQWIDFTELMFKDNEAERLYFLCTFKD
ncbi:hypothetical protein [Bacillus pinisoli]|uniref:hypothetical protein n=1 Tax=Bacillus pinisoli TaxID=2901866 RepID=UPI001FF21531|nr:hypothetical protein [Bacillus pinisoli]